MGAGVAATGVLYLIKRNITYRRDMNLAAGRIMPWLVAVMAWAFTTFMLIKGLGAIIHLPISQAFWIGLGVAVVVFAIALAATLTVILAAQLGMPVSTTHVTIGALFGVGFLREYLKTNYARMEKIIVAGHKGSERAAVETYLKGFEAAPVAEKRQMLAEMKRRARAHDTDALVFAKKERKAMKKAYKSQLVKRSMVLRIVAAWVITVPATAVLAALLYRLITWWAPGL